MFELKVSRNLFCVNYDSPGLRRPDIGTHEPSFMFGLLSSISLRQEILDWIKESKIGRYELCILASHKRVCTSEKPLHANSDFDFELLFNTESDMIAFKMRWL